MTARSTDQLLDAFLADGPTELPDRTYEVVRSDIHRTRQRVVLGPWREPNVTTIYRLAIAAAVVAAVGVAWVNLVPRQDNNVGGPTPSPNVTPSPIPVPSMMGMPPGRYRFEWRQAAGSEGEAGPSITITIPSTGWTSFEQFAADKNYSNGAQAGPSFVVWKITNRYDNACLTEPPPAGGVTHSPVPGPGSDQLLTVLADQPGLTAGPLTPVTIDGFTGKYVELTVATDINKCGAGFYPWLDKFVQGNNEVLRVYALDVNGFRLTFFLRIPEITKPEDRAELLSIVDSIDIQP